MTSVVAVVDSAQGTPVVWWVDLGIANPVMGRLGGAWVFDNDELREKLPHLIRGRLVLATGPGAELLTAAGMVPGGVLDVQAMRAAIADEQCSLQAAFDEEFRRRGQKGLTAPSWPASLEPLDVDAASVEAGDPRARRALAVARHLEKLCRTWEEIEEQRLARPALRKHGGQRSRPVPVVVSSAIPQQVAEPALPRPA